MSGARAVISEFRDSEGWLFTKVKRPEWRRPDRVELVGESELHIWSSGSLLELDFLEEHENAPVVRPPADLLERFLELNTASGPQIRKFAGKYGPLGIFQKIERPKPSLGQHLDHWCEVESCSVWRYFASVFGALLRITWSVYSGRPSDPKDRDCMCPDFFSQEIRERYYDSISKRFRGGGSFSDEENWFLMAGLYATLFGDSVGTARYGLTSLMDILLEMAKIRPYFAWSSRNARPQVLYAGSSLLSYLVLQLSNRMAKIDGHAFCDHCGKHYEPDRAPRSDRRNFCPDCHDAGIPVQLAVRKYREKQRSRKVSRARA
jgi:hypothetical protein